MDWFKTVMLVLAVANAVIFPVHLVKVIRRRDSACLFESLVSAAALFVVYAEAFRPGLIHSSAPPLRWLAMTVLFLFAANIFGFSQRLFRSKTKSVSPPA